MSKKSQKCSFKQWKKQDPIAKMSGIQVVPSSPNAKVARIIDRDQRHSLSLQILKGWKQGVSYATVTPRWDIEVFFGDTKDLLGLDQYQVLRATALLALLDDCAGGLPL